MNYTDDPIADFDRYDAECERKLERLPKCRFCEEPITDETGYFIDHEYICSDCLESECKVFIVPEL